MSAAPTPGPLVTRRSKRNGDHAILTAAGDVVAECYEAIRRYDEKATEEAGANAKLYAAAPQLVEALRGIQVLEHGSVEQGTKEVWFLLRSDGKNIGAGSVRLTGPFADAMSLWAEKRRAALAAAGAV